MKKLGFLIFILGIILFNTTLMAWSQEDAENPDANVSYATGKILKITGESHNQILESALGGNQTLQKVTVKILDGADKGKIFKTENQLTSNPAYDVNIKKGDRVILDIEHSPDQKMNIFISDKERLPVLILLGGTFLLLLLLIGGMKGLKSIVALAITGLLVAFAFIPAVLNSYPIIPVTIGICLASTLSTILIICGINVKSLSAIIGTLGGLTFAGIIAVLAIKCAPLSGLTDQESIILWSSRPDLSFRSLLVAAMLIGSLGAVLDVGISIASAIEEIKNANSSLSRKELIKAGFNVGKDIMGAMSTTLIMAYIGESIALIMLAANAPLVKLINLNSIATEITAALAGSIGIILCVPITAVVSGYLINYQRELNAKKSLLK